MLLGCFSWDGEGPIFWIKNCPIVQDGYMDILDNVMLPYADWNIPLQCIYQQDNDPKHTAKKVKNQFSRKKGQSPDLIPIENLWKDVKTAVGHKKTNNQRRIVVQNLKCLDSDSNLKMPKSNTVNAEPMHSSYKKSWLFC